MDDSFHFPLISHVFSRKKSAGYLGLYCTLQLYLTLAVGYILASHGTSSPLYLQPMFTVFEVCPWHFSIRDTIIKKKII